jgi:hypothetical protein
MTRSFRTSDGRLVARLIMLAHRFGCDYRELTVTRDALGFAVTVTFDGNPEPLRRLGAQIEKLLDYEKEIA